MDKTDFPLLNRFDAGECCEDDPGDDNVATFCQLLVGCPILTPIPQSIMDFLANGGLNDPDLSGLSLDHSM